MAGGLIIPGRTVILADGTATIGIQQKEPIRAVRNAIKSQTKERRSSIKTRRQQDRSLLDASTQWKGYA